MKNLFRLTLIVSLSPCATVGFTHAQSAGGLVHWRRGVYEGDGGAREVECANSHLLLRRLVPVLSRA